uniref:Uncharacterized protein n=1 Tax=Arundo donax TaxID=35708 RepID=A0A0A9EZY4_ARUDO
MKYTFQHMHQLEIHATIKFKHLNRWTLGFERFEPGGT